MSRLVSFAVRYIHQIARYKWLVIFLSFAFTGYFVSQLQHVKITTDYKIFFSPKNPELGTFQALEDSYTQSDYFLIALHTGKGDLFNPRHLRAIVELTEASWQAPYSIRVESMSNFQHTTADEDDLYIEDLIEDPAGYSEDHLEKLKGIALQEPSL